MSNTRRVATGGLFVLAFVLNPALFTGCRPGPEFGEKEVVALAHDVAAVRTYGFASNGADYEVVMQLAQVEGVDKVSLGESRPSPVRVAHACSDRTFLRSAAACEDVTKVPLEGTLTIRRTKPTAATVVDHESVTAELTVYGTRLDSANLALVVHSRDLQGFFTGGGGRNVELGALDLTGAHPGGPLAFKRN
jgi:hypothetical protein